MVNIIKLSRTSNINMKAQRDKKNLSQKHIMKSSSFFLQFYFIQSAKRNIRKGKQSVTAKHIDHKDIIVEIK